MRSVGVHRLSAIPHPADAGRPEVPSPPKSDDDESEECIEYDVYGWFKFESDADVLAASTVSGSRCMIWSRQTALGPGRQRFSSCRRSWAATWRL